MKHKILLLLTTLTHVEASGPTIELEHEAFMHVMKERVIQFPEESQKLSYINELQYEDSLLEPNTTEEELPKLKDTFQTTLLSRARRSNRNGQRKNRGNRGQVKGSARGNRRNRYRNYNYNSYSTQQRTQSSTTWSKGWTGWGSWTPCSHSCGPGGIQTRRRYCANSSYNSNSCSGSALQTQKCFIKQCVTYSWSKWAAWTECTKTCGGGMRYRARSCYAQTAQRPQVSNDKCGKDLFWDYDNCQTQSCFQPLPATQHSPDAEHSATTPEQPKCGVKQQRKSLFSSFAPSLSTQADKPKLGVQLRIAGGQEASHGDWPWQVSFQHRTCRKAGRGGTRLCTWKHLCGASIVDNKWVVTAAHCIAESGFFYDPYQPGEDWSVVVGMDKLHNERLGSSNAGTRIFLDKIVVHDTYRFNYITHADIALLKLSEAVEYNDYVQPICFPDGQEPQHGDMCHITGWGFTSGTGDELSYHLKEAQIPIVDFSECRNVDVWYKLLNGEVHMCAGDRVRGGVDSCGGDSGGPLSCQRKDGSFYLAGVTSFGFSDCGKKGHVGIYARMTTFEEWAKKTIAADEGDYSYYYEDFHNLDSYRSQSGPK